MRYVPHFISGLGIGMLAAAFDWSPLAIVGLGFISAALLGVIQGDDA